MTRRTKILATIVVLIVGIVFSGILYALYHGINFSPLADHKYVNQIERNYLELAWTAGVVDSCERISSTDTSVDYHKRYLAVLRTFDVVYPQHRDFVNKTVVRMWFRGSDAVREGNVRCDDSGNDRVSWPSKFTKMLNVDWIEGAGGETSRPADLYNASLQVGLVFGWALACNRDNADYSEGLYVHKRLIEWMAIARKRIAMADAVRSGALVEAEDAVRARRLSCEKVDDALADMKVLADLLYVRNLVGFAP